MFRKIAALIGSLALVMAAASCSTASAASNDVPLQISENTVIVDVRTPAEYAEGHLAGAELLDFNGGQLQSALTSLDPEAEYVVYCRSGNRSAQAIKLMQDAGIDNVTNLGSLAEAADATNIEIVR